MPQGAERSEECGAPAQPLTPGYSAVDNEIHEIDESRPVCPAFKEIGSRLGPIDLAFLPIGAYSSRWFLSTVHCAPIDAVRVFKDVVSCEHASAGGSERRANLSKLVQGQPGEPESASRIARVMRERS